MNVFGRLVFRAFDAFARRYEDFRVERLRSRLGACGARVYLSPHCIVWCEEKLRVGNDVCIHSFTHIFAGGGVTLGDGVMISSNCSISSVTHHKEPKRRAETIIRPVVIGSNVWIGTGAIILPGVTIGENAIVGAGAVVTRDVPAQSIYAGNPARRLASVPQAGEKPVQ